MLRPRRAALRGLPGRPIRGFLEGVSLCLERNSASESPSNRGMDRMRWLVIALTTLALTGSVPAVSAQNTQDTSRPSFAKPADKPTTISVDAKLVNVPVVVRDKKGALVQSLAKDDFNLQVDGKQQAIRYFDLDTNLPLQLGLLVDTSMSMA